MERGQRECEQDDGKDRRPALIVLGADDGEEDLGREHFVVPAEHQGVAEVGEALDETEEEGVGESGAHQGQGYRAEGAPAVGAQGERRFLHGRADALDHPDEHQEGDGGEGQRLGQPDAGQTVDPAARLHSEHGVQRFGDGSGASEEQNDREPDHEGRCDDGQHGEDPQQPLGPKSGPGDDEGESEAQEGGRDPDEHRHPQGVPGHPAGERPPEAVEAPDGGRHELLREHRRREVARVVLEGAQQDRHHGKEDEGGDERDHETDGSHDEHVAPDQTARRHPAGEQEQEGAHHEHRAVAHPELPVLQGAEGAFEQGELPARDADGKALAEHRQQAQRADADQGVGEGRVVGVPPRYRERREEKEGEGRQPPPLVRERLYQARRLVPSERIPAEPGEAPEAVVEGVPGQDRESDPADDAPQGYVAIHPYRGGERVRRASAQGFRGRSHRRPRKEFAASAIGAGSSPRHPTWRAGACAPRTIRTWRSRSR